jgi:hypothetical protein
MNFPKNYSFPNNKLKIILKSKIIDIYFIYIIYYMSFKKKEVRKNKCIRVKIKIIHQLKLLN